MSWRNLALAGLLMWSAPALAQVPAGEANSQPHVITNPDWRTRPTGEALARFYPDRAQRANIDGYATISCTVTAAGRLSPCRVVSEGPEGYGFGQAALKLAPMFQMTPKTVDGLGVDGGTVRIPIVFRIPADNREPEPQWRRVAITMLAVVAGLGGIALKMLNLFPNLGRPRRRPQTEPAA